MFKKFNKTKSKRYNIKLTAYKEFDYIWKDILYDLIKDYICDLNVVCFFISFKKTLLKWLYYRYSRKFINKYMVLSTKKIDMHKISSCITKSILTVRPLNKSFRDMVSLFFHQQKNNERFCALDNSNELLALSTVFSIMDSCLESEDNTVNNLEIDEKHRKKLRHRIELPVPFDADDQKEYLYNICLDLSNTKGRRFNLVSYSNIFFLLEKYSCRKAQCDNLIDEYKISFNELNSVYNFCTTLNKKYANINVIDGDFFTVENFKNLDNEQIINLKNIFLQYQEIANSCKQYVVTNQDHIDKYQNKNFNEFIDSVRFKARLN